MKIEKQYSDASHFRKTTILIIDDDPESLTIMTEYLGGGIYTILVAEDGESGVERAEYAKPDLILLDVMMPAMNGYETCRRLKAIESTKEIPVIFMTALAETEHKVRGFAAGAVDYITKPFQREEVLARVGVHVGNRELAKRLQEAKASLEKRVEERTATLARTNKELNWQITERLQAEDELRESREQYRTVVEDMPVMVCRFLPGGCLTFVNGAFCSYFDKKREDLQGQEYFRFIADKDRDKVKKLYGALDRGCPITTHEHEVVSRDGTVRWLESTGRALFDEQGRLVEYQSIGKDVTESKFIEKEKARLERQLQQAQKMEALGALAGGISHDFNNILSVIVGCAELSLLTVSDKMPAYRYLKQLLQACVRARDLVQQILTFSRQKEIERKPLNIGSLCKEVLKMMRASLPTTIKIEQSIDPQSGAALVDATQFHQVLVNLCTNAAHAMEEKGGVLRTDLSHVNLLPEDVEHEPDFNPGSYIKLSVKDTGHGMPPEIADRIFDPYFTTKKADEGTGLGLAVVHGIVKSYGGAVKVFTIPGKGTTFDIFLPRLASANGQKEVRDKNALPGGVERILFVDDEEAFVRTGYNIMEHLGYDVVVATSGVKALEIFKKDPQGFDLVITDQIMPELTGVQLAEQLLLIRPEIPIAICTGLMEGEVRKRAETLGVRAIIDKPPTTRVLAEKIREILDQRQKP